MDETQRTQFPNLPLVDRRLKAEIELIEVLHKGQMRQLQSSPQIAAAPRIHFTTQQSRSESCSRRRSLAVATPAFRARVTSNKRKWVSFAKHRSLCTRAAVISGHVYSNYGNVKLNNHKYTIQPEYSNLAHLHSVDAGRGGLPHAQVAACGTAHLSSQGVPRRSPHFPGVLAYHLLTAIEKTLLDGGVHTSWAAVREQLKTHQGRWRGGRQIWAATATESAAFCRPSSTQ